MIFMISRSNHPMSKSIWYRLWIFPKEIVSLHKNLTVNSVLIQTITCYCETCTLSRPSVCSICLLWDNCGPTACCCQDTGPTVPAGRCTATLYCSAAADNNNVI